MDYFASDELIVPKAGDLLISEPYLQDVNFDRKVILVCANDENGSFGLVLNHRTNLKISDYVEDIKSNNPIFVGGPVERDTLHYVHRSEILKNSSRKLKEKIYWGGNFQQITDMMTDGTLTEKEIIFFVGYSGWGAGQLMQELKTKSWIVFQNTSEKIIFDWNNQKLWELCLKDMGGKYKLISNYPTDPSMN